MDEKVCKIKFTPQCKKDSVCIYLPLQDVRVKRWLTALPKLPATFRRKCIKIKVTTLFFFFSMAVVGQGSVFPLGSVLKPEVST